MKNPTDLYEIPLEFFLFIPPPLPSVILIGQGIEGILNIKKD